MSEILKVEHFGPIRKAELELKKTTVLIGPQGSGKSTLAKLVAIFLDMPFHGSGPEYTNFDLEAENYEMELYGSSSTHIIFDNSSISFEVIDNTIIKNKAETSKYTIFVPTERTLLSILSNSILSLINRDINLPKSLKEFGSKYEFARKRSNGLKIDYLGIEYRLYGGHEFLIKDDKELELSQSASGYQAIIPIKLVVENYLSNEQRSFIIEEPELNLYPTTQKDLVYYLANRCTKNENELLMTTHSPYVLSALNNLLFAYQVAQKHPDKEEEISKIIPKESWLNPAEFAAYYVGEGTVRSIINTKTGMISENELDTASELIGEEFDNLMDIYRTPIHAYTNS